MYETYILKNNEDFLKPLSSIYGLKYYDFVQELMQKLLDEGLINEQDYQDKMWYIERNNEK